MGNVYELHADESWTHDNEHTGRYWCFFGGVFAETSEMDRLQTRLLRVRQDHDLKIEKVNYKNIQAANATPFQAFADAFFAHLHAHSVKYRQMFLDKSYVHIDSDGAVGETSRIELIHKVYYQFLKHSFRMQDLPRATIADPHLIRIRLDQASSNVHQSRLVELAGALPQQWARPDIKVDVRFIKAKSSQAMQLADLLCGCAAFHGNRMCQRREPGKRGMKAKQRVRDQLARHVYNLFRAHDAAHRGSKAFNWFETTGGDSFSQHENKLRIWKFKPTDCIRDLGWENDRLDKQGRYQASFYASKERIPRDQF